MADYRCRKFLNEGDKMQLYVNGMIPKIRTLVDSYPENQTRSDLKLEKLVKYA